MVSGKCMIRTQPIVYMMYLQNQAILDHHAFCEAIIKSKYGKQLNYIYLFGKPMILMNGSIGWNSSLQTMIERWMMRSMLIKK